MPDNNTSLELNSSQMPNSELVESKPEPDLDPTAFPPYPPYVVKPAPPSVADTIIAGHGIRRQHKSVAKPPVHASPKPALPRGPKATDVKLRRRALKAHERCLRRHGTVLTDRLERIAKPRRRNIIYLWREFAQKLPSYTIARLRSMLDADEPFKPDQAYEYFINVRKMRRKNATSARVSELKKDILSMYGEKRFMWARNATITFARGIQHRLSKPGCYALADGMLRLSDIVLEEICGYMHMKIPSRRNKSPKARFMIEMADKVAVWIDEILAESDDRMLMMDFDEDEDILGPSGRKFEDDFLDMMGDDGASKNLLKSLPAYLQFSGPMLEAFNVLTESMYKKGDAKLLTHGKFNQTYAEAADELKQTTDFHATEYNSNLANQINKDLTKISKPNTPSDIANHMKDMVDICSKYLSQFAEYNKEKGPGFNLLIGTMRTKPREELYHKEKLIQTYGGGAYELEKAKGLENDHDDPNLTEDIHSSLQRLMEQVTPDSMKTEVKDAIDISAKYLSQQAIEKHERGPAFDILIKKLQHDGADHFSDFPTLSNKFAAAYVLKSAPGLTAVNPDPATAPTFTNLLHKTIDSSTPKNQKESMRDVIDRCANYLSAFVRDRDIVLTNLLQMMKSKPKHVFASRPKYSMNYQIAASETEAAPTLVPYLPVKDVVNEGKVALTKDMEDLTPPELKIPMKALIQDVSRHLSQPFALRSEIAGPRYPLEFLASVTESLGEKPLFKYKSYGQSYADAGHTLMIAGPLEDSHQKSAVDLQHQIKAEVKTDVPKQIASTIIEDLRPTIDNASKHLASVATEKGDTLDHLVGLMKEKGEIPLAQLQGYEQSYTDGARRLEYAPSLANEKVDKVAYETVKTKLNTITTAKPDLIPEKHTKHLPEMIELSSKYLSAPIPETNADKRRVLADLMARKGDLIVGEEGAYKMTHKEGGAELKNAPVGQTTAADEGKRIEILAKVNTVVPDQKMQTLLKDSIQEGAAHLTDTIKGRGEAMKLLQENMKKEKNKDLITVGAFSKTHEGGAAMLDDAPNFGPGQPAPVLVNIIDRRLAATLTEDTVPHIAKEYIKDVKDITSKYIAGVATKQSGLDAKALEELDEATFIASEMEAERLAREKAERLRKGGKLTAEERERLAKEEAEKLARLAKEEAERLAREAEQRQIEAKEALGILQAQLRAHGNEVFYEQSLTSLTHNGAADCLTAKPVEVEKLVKDSGDTMRLTKKFEKKLNTLTAPVTPAAIHDSMQDVIIESAQQLSENFITTNYKVHARDALISEMQKRGNEILIEVDGAAETTFFAAQRLKKEKNLKGTEPCTELAPRLNKTLDTIMRRRAVPRKLTSTVKEHTKDAADFLSVLVTKPDQQIEAYVALLEEMEASGDKPLIEGKIPKSYKEAAAYLRQLTSFEDKINCPNKSLQSNINGKLQNLMSNVVPAGYSKQDMNSVIQNTAQLLASYITLEEEKTQALIEMIKHMDEAGNNILLRHGTVHKTFKNGADILRGKTTDQLTVLNADPVVVRKIELKLTNLITPKTPKRFMNVMNDVIHVATMYLGVHLLEPQIVKICKCMKSEFVQCEMWCEEILRRVAKPPCTCSRHISMQDLKEIPTSGNLNICPGTSRVLASGLELEVTECRSKHTSNVNIEPDCQASKPSRGCFENTTTSYLLDSISYSRDNSGESPTRIPEPSSSNYSLSILTNAPSSHLQSGCSSTVHSLLMEIYSQDINFSSNHEYLKSNTVCPKTPIITTLFANGSPYQIKLDAQNHVEFAAISSTEAVKEDNNDSLTPSLDPKISQANLSQACHSTRTQISTDKMTDWHAMLVSLLWNVEAWRNWIQESIDRGLKCQLASDDAPYPDSWASFQRRISAEALQWRQYNIFSRKLTLRLISRYKDKEIISRGAIKTESYHECARGMLDIIRMFNKWTQWLILLVKETGVIERPSGCKRSLNMMRWSHYKKNVLEYINDWINYNMLLKLSWEKKFETFITESIPHVSNPSPLWVMSASGAVPSGAVSAGIFDGEVIWVARTTHKRQVLPAALHPSKHCCIMYAGGASCLYTKYQVLCNVEVDWVAWRGGRVSEHAIQVAEDTYAGRVLHRGSHLVGAVVAPLYCCEVNIFGRPLSFNCYELLVQAQKPKK